MGIRSVKPTSPGRRELIKSDFAEITRNYPERSLLAPLRKHGGRTGGPPKNGKQLRGKEGMNGKTFLGWKC